MACPHFSVRDNECLLVQDQPEDEEQLLPLLVCGGGDRLSQLSSVPALRRRLAALNRAAERPPEVSHFPQ